MPETNSNTRQVLILLLGALAGIPLIAWGASEQGGYLVFLGILGLVALYLSFVRLSLGMYFLAIAMLLSPELTMGASRQMAGSMEATRPIALRVDDFLIAAMAIGWFVKSAYQGERYAISWTPINGAAWFYLATAAVATALGIIRGNVPLRSGFFYNLKYFEYFLLYLITLGTVKRREQAERLLGIMLVVFIIVSLNGWRQVPSGHRVFAPFDTEPNTLSGYFILVGSVAGAIGLCSRSRLVKWLTFGSIAFAFVPFLYTRSRAGYLGFIAAYLAFIAYGRQRYLLIFSGALVMAMMAIGWVSMPKSVIDRIRYTFSGETQTGIHQYTVGGFGLDPSTSARLDSYRHAISVWLEHPILGAGVTGAGFLDGQYFRTLEETGIVGLAALLYLLWRIYEALTFIYRNTAEDSIFKGVSLGLLCAFFGLVTHALAANTFIIIRIAEPFWLLVGIALLAPRFDQWYPKFLRHYHHSEGTATPANVSEIVRSAPKPLIVRPIPKRPPPAATP